MTCMQGRLWPRSEEEAAKALALGYDLKKVLHLHDLCRVSACVLLLPGVAPGVVSVLVSAVRLLQADSS